MDASYPQFTDTAQPGPQSASHDRPSQRRRLAALLLAPCLAGLALVLLLGAARPVRAAGVVGTGTPESCTYEALIGAMQGAGLVTFNCGALPHTIVVTFTGGVQPLGGQHTTLDGGGLITLSGDNSQRLFHVFPNTYFTLTHITLAHGYSSAAPGGALYNRGRLVLDDVTIHSSHAQTPTWGGGAIYNYEDATLTVRNATLRGNLSGGGGAINNAPYGSVTIENSQFLSNTVVGLYGGAIYNGGVLSVLGGVFSGNVVTYTGAYPGVPYGGGAIANDDTLLPAVTVLSGVAFAGNQSAYDGGAIFNNSVLTLTGGLLSDNTASQYGGGLHNFNQSALVSGTTFSGNHAGRGGGLYNEGGSLRLLNTSVNGNSAQIGAGFAARFGASHIVDSALIGNVSDNVGGGGEINDSTAYLTRTLVAGNTGFECGGLLSSEGTLSLYATTVSGNSATGGVGGGVCATGPGGSLLLVDTTVSGNTVDGIGGGVMTWAPSATLVNSTLSGNAAAEGGGLYNAERASLLNVTLSHNTAGNGAGLYTTAGATTLLTNTVIANSPTGGDCGGAAIAAARYSLASDSTCGLPPANNFNNTDPLLNPLADTGGPTLTHLPRLGSPLIDGVVGSLAPATDQRGLPRPQGGAYDIGAVERQAEDTDVFPRLWLPFVRR